MNPSVSFSPARLAETLREGCPEVLWAFLFGSAQQGVVPEGGDMDIGVWLANPDDRIKLIPETEIDLTILNQAQSLLAMKALQGSVF